MNGPASSHGIKYRILLKVSKQAHKRNIKLNDDEECIMALHTSSWAECFQTGVGGFWTQFFNQYFKCFYTLCGVLEKVAGVWNSGICGSHFLDIIRSTDDEIKAMTKTVHTHSMWTMLPSDGLCAILFARHSRGTVISLCHHILFASTPSFLRCSIIAWERAAPVCFSSWINPMKDSTGCKSPST